MNKIRALVVDDEPLARERVLTLLQQETDVEVVGECSDGGQAVSAIQQHSPDLVFLDVQMPGCDGFEVIQNIGIDRMPMVIFVTAYDQYALRAFEVHALDYLLKPFGKERFRETLKHAREGLERRRAGDLGRRLLALVNDVKPEPPRVDRLVVKSGGRVFFLRTDEIDWIEAAGNYVRLHLGTENAPVPRDDEPHGVAARHADASPASTARASSTPSGSRSCSPGSTATTSSSCATARG